MWFRDVCLLRRLEPGVSEPDSPSKGQPADDPRFASTLTHGKHEWPREDHAAETAESSSSGLLNSQLDTIRTTVVAAPVAMAASITTRGLTSVLEWVTNAPRGLPRGANGGVGPGLPAKRGGDIGCRASDTYLLPSSPFFLLNQFVLTAAVCFVHSFPRKAASSDTPQRP